MFFLRRVAQAATLFIARTFSADGQGYRLPDVVVQRISSIFLRRPLFIR